MNRLIEAFLPEVNPGIAADRRQQERISISAPVRIVAVNGHPACYHAVCCNVSHGGVAFETAAVLEVGKVVEFEFVHDFDQPCRYYSRILYRNGDSYGAYYVNDDGSDIRQQN